MDRPGLYNYFRKSSKVCIDSRKAIPDAMFFALKGDNFDGNEFAGHALDEGCSLAVVDDPESVSDDRFILVEDALRSLQELARYHRQCLNIPILAITGSNGKTTTKELIAAMLETSFRITATPGNLNNHIGVPLTLLEMDENTQIGIVEMGANHLGEIARLCEIAKPDNGIITNIGSAHLEGFGTQENVQRAKAELYEWLRNNNGTVFQNGGHPLLRAIPTDGAKTIVYKIDENLFTEIKSEPFLEFVWHTHGRAKTVKTRLFGTFNMENIAAAITISGYFGVRSDSIVRALENYVPGNNRSQIIKTQQNLLFLDAYNANPTSMKVAIEDFMNIAGDPKILILGDMLELGTHSSVEHQKIVEYINGLPVDRIILIGREFSEADTGSDMNCYQTMEEYKTFLAKHPLRKSRIFLKGSRRIKLEELVPGL